jgi:4-hydroxy-tetrahydrodipicolinate reductase
MRFALVGYGRMGREIERVAAGRGHRLAAIVDPKASGPKGFRSIGAKALRGVDVAFEFTRPDTAEENVIALLARNVSVVCGTTGWDASSRAVRAAARRSRAAAVVGPNFSPGMALFYRVVEEAARLYLALPSYDPFVLESHHRGKADAPSGTARRLAEILARPVRIGTPDAPLAPGEVHVVSVRAGHEAGEHTVGFDGEHDAIALTHRSRGRSGFALGAVLAAEWIGGRRGVHGFDEVVDGIVRAAKGGRR